MTTIPDSISALVYHMKHPWLWTIMIELSVFILLPLMCGFSDTYSIIAFSSCACMGFVGVMPLFIKETKVAHYFFAILGALLSQLWCVLVGNWLVILGWWALYLVFLGILAITGYADKWCLFAELWCIAGILGILLI